MPAYLLLLVAVLSRLLPHAGWMNFTAVGGALLYFGARRLVAGDAGSAGGARWPPTTSSPSTATTTPSPGRSMLPTWAWYGMAMALGQILLRARTTVVRVAAGALLGPTSFFLVSNYATWVSGLRSVSADVGRAGRLLRGRLCPSIATTCSRRRLWPGWPLGVPVLVRRMSAARTQMALAGK